jgi:protein tyrosine/serine phosphatase
LNTESKITGRAPLQRRRFRRGPWIALIAISLVLGLLSYVGTFNGNVRVVEPNRVYRSGQLVGPQLVDVLKSRHIRSVVNMRGHLPEDVRLHNEWAVCKRMGIAHVDISTSAGKLPRPNEVRKLLTELDTLPRPMLIHCAGGSDRTGLACTLYMNIYERMPLDEAQSSQLTWRYGHLSFGAAHPMDDFFTLYRKTGKDMSIHTWAIDRYPGVYAELMRHRSERTSK